MGYTKLLSIFWACSIELASYIAQNPEVTSLEVFKGIWYGPIDITYCRDRIYLPRMCSHMRSLERS
jgi:hypothetical protein